MSSGALTICLCGNHVAVSWRCGDRSHTRKYHIKMSSLPPPETICENVKHGPTFMQRFLCVYIVSVACLAPRTQVLSCLSLPLSSPTVSCPTPLKYDLSQPLPTVRPSSSRIEELQRLSTRRGGGSTDGGDKRKGRQQRGSGSRGWAGDDLSHRLALQTMDNYSRSLRVGATPRICLRVSIWSCVSL